MNNFNQRKDIKVALIQMNSVANQEVNLQKAIELSKQALSKNAKLIAFPEVFNYRKRYKSEAIHKETLDGKCVTIFKDLAKSYNCYILLGSISELIPNSKKVYNTSVMISDKGAVIGVYRKMHLFDVEVDNVKIKESSVFERGDSPELVSVCGHNLGMSICYDLRFAELYRYYTCQNATIIAVPSSFTKKTGQAHWLTLLKARAIENQVYVLAPNQVGIGGNGIETFGHSVIIDPWGTVVACGSASNEEVVIGDVSVSEIERIRKGLPCLDHRLDTLNNNNY
ncbi:hypothetical protein DID75_01225 [Candidatus Marinamargulisbacteria bacterium SCGC AG-410-N11]|nr:hypothetical protein DID75_01225 [Candidatus Marinamargulisbacteria bacterium SCGC AG-410-N11]